MEFSENLDRYCERIAPHFWAEPVNALSNLAFLLAAGAVLAWLGRAGAPVPLARGLAAWLAAIGVGSGLWHTLATGWAALADVAGIAGFVLTYLYAVNRHVLGWRPWAAVTGVLAFFPYAALAGAGFAALPGFAVSAGYWPVALLIALYAAALWRRRPGFARGLAAGAALLCLSLLARSVDAALCAAWPLGTHFLWHLLNAAMLGWMIVVYARQVLATRAARG